MKRFLLIASFMLLSLGAFANGGNDYRSSIGVRGGYGAEFSYQRYISLDNRIEATVGFHRYGFEATATHQWMFDIPADVKGTFKWYAGAGAGIGAWNSDKHDKGFSFAVKGQVGIEYTFSFPFMISLDYRPGLNFFPESGFDFTGIGLGFRYCF